MIKGEVIGSINVQNSLERAKIDFGQGVARAIFALTIELERIVKEDKLSGQVLKTKTSNLRNSITHRFNATDKSASGEVGTNIRAIPYARIHEFGGIIQAKKAKYLKFKINGRWVQKKSVKMPQRSYLRSALKNLQPKVQEYVFAEMRRIKL